MPSESVFYLSGIFLLFGILVYIYFNFIDLDDKKNEINPDYLIGLKYLLNEESDKAINLFSNLIKIDEETIQTHLALGVLFRKQGKIDKAIQLHEYILSKDDLPEKHYFQTLFELGENYFTAGIYDKAEDIFLKLKDYPEHSEASLGKLIIINEYFGEWKEALSYLEELDTLGIHDLSISRNHYYCEIAENHINNGDINLANDFLLKAHGLHTDSIRGDYIKMLIELRNSNIDSALSLFSYMSNKNPVAYLIALPKILEYSNSHNINQINTALRKNLDNDRDANIYLAIVAVMFPKVKNEVIETTIQLFIENQDIVKEINKLGDDFSIPSTVSNRLSHSMRIILNEKMKPEYKFNCKKCGYQTIAFSWQCPTCKSWESSQPINFLKAI